MIEQYAPYHWYRTVIDTHGDELTVAQREGNLYLDVTQENGLIIFDLKRCEEFEVAYAEAKRRAVASEAARPTEGAS